MSDVLTGGGAGQAVGGRPPALDAAKRQTVLALLTNGFSRRMAARYVGCAPSTIAQTAQRDPAFAEELGQAENSVDVEMLAAVRRAATQDRYWRAAAWLLERRNREEFCFAAAARDEDGDIQAQQREYADTLALAAAVQRRPLLEHLNRAIACVAAEAATGTEVVFGQYPANEDVGLRRGAGAEPSGDNGLDDFADGATGGPPQRDVSNNLHQRR